MIIDWSSQQNYFACPGLMIAWVGAAFSLSPIRILYARGDVLTALAARGDVLTALTARGDV